MGIYQVEARQSLRLSRWNQYLPLRVLGLGEYSIGNAPHIDYQAGNFNHAAKPIACELLDGTDVGT